MKKLEENFDLPVPPQEAMNRMRNPKFIEASERSRDALAVRIEPLQETESTHHFIIHVTSHARTVKGIDKTKTEENHTTVQWDLADTRGTWTWRGAHGGMVEINGTYRLVPQGDGARLTMTAAIDVKIPLVGRVVEGKVAKGFLSAWPAYAQRIRDGLPTGDA